MKLIATTLSHNSKPTIHCCMSLNITNHQWLDTKQRVNFFPWLNHMQHLCMPTLEWYSYIDLPMEILNFSRTLVHYSSVLYYGIYHFHTSLQREEKVYKHCHSVLRNALTRNGGSIYNI